MSRYIVRRLLVALPTVLAVAVAATVVTTLPGTEYEYPTHSFYNTPTNCDWLGASFTSSPMLAVAAGGGTTRLDPGCSYGLVREKSAAQQRVELVVRTLRGDLGRSFHSSEPVNELITRRLPASVQLAIMAMAVAVLTAVPLGVLAAVRHDRWPDHVARLTSLAGHAVPDFLLAATVFFLLSYWLGWLPDLSYPTLWEQPVTSLLAFGVPALIVGWRIGAISARMTRSAVLDMLQQDYVRTARAKGLTESAVVIRHALRNALLPVLTIMGNQLPALLAGLVVIEIVFGIRGLGTLGFEAMQVEDYPVVRGVLFVIALCVIGTNLVVDVARAAMDPRIRYQ